MVKMIGRPIGHWILERVLKPGGMGGVFLARHATLGTPAAVKILTRNAVPGAEAHERLRHPHVVRVHDSLEEAGVRFLVLEYLPGAWPSAWRRGHRPRRRPSAGSARPSRASATATPGESSTATSSPGT